MKAPVGYINNARTRNIEPEPTKAKVIQNFFTEFAQGHYTLETGRHQLSALGITYTPFMIHRLLTNKIYLGLMLHKGELHEGNFQPLIDKVTFEMVQKRLKERAKPRKSKKLHDFPFRGMFKCAECGGQITAQFAKGNGGTYRYYRCSKKFGTCKQGYLREDLLLGQLKVQFQKIAILDDWAENMLKEIEIWQKESQLKTKTSVQNVDAKIRLIEMRMDKLVNAFLDGLIEKENYLKKKDEILREKFDLKLKHSDFGAEGKNWVEPLRDWVKTLENAGKLSCMNADLSAYKALSEKVGSNRLLQDKKIVWDWLPPFRLALQDKGFQAATKKSSDGSELEKGEAKKELLCWRAGGYNFRTSNPLVA